MSDEISREKAMILLDQAYRLQMRGELGMAINLYKRSLNIYETAEAHTFLGWTYSMFERYDEAITECKKAIEIDPEYGNPYNDIGAYLIATEKWEEAIPWLEKAIKAPRYETLQHSYMNMGHIYKQLGQYHTALSWYDKALNVDPFSRSVLREKYKLIGKLN